MKAKLIFTLFSILSVSTLFGQQKEEIEAVKPKREVLVGFDILNAGTSFFSDRQLFQGFLATKVTNKIYANVDFGFDKNDYDKNGYDVEASGFFVKAGASYMLVQDPDNKFNGFYAGPKIGASFYQQNYFKVPVRGYEAGDYYISYPQSNQSSYWLEAGIGGRVQLFDSNFFIDVQVQPRYLLYSTKQEHLEPMIVPGFGKSSSGFNMGFAWNIAYKF